MRLNYRSDASSAGVAGFDHPSAVFTWFGIAGGLLPWLVVPTFIMWPWPKALLFTVGALVALTLLVLPLHFRVVVHPTKIVLDRLWAGIRYKRVEVLNSPELEFFVNGTGDWNDEGMWPGKHYCEMVAPGQSDLMLGTPGRAEELAAWLRMQARRVAEL